MITITLPTAQVVKDPEAKNSLVVEHSAGSKPRYRVRSQNVAKTQLFEFGTTVEIEPEDYEQLISLKSNS
jgi:hypothetical protein